jgi:urea transport system permease protein
MDLLRNRAKLGSPDPDSRRSAATDLGTSGRTVAIPWLDQAAATESNKWVRYTMQESAALLHLAEDDQAAKISAVRTLGDLASQNAVPALQEFVALGSAAEATEAQQALAKVASVSIERIETWAVWSSAIETIFRGVSLSSILLIMSVGLAIVFGLMGVINMAHGELMMVGAYATFITQELFKAFLPTAIFDYYFAAAMPMAFVVAAACGMVLELTVIRWRRGVSVSCSCKPPGSISAT